MTEEKKQKEAIRGYKEHKYIVFEFESGSKVKYDLSNGDVIGKHGRLCKSLNSQLSGYNIHEVIDCFEDQNYKRLLRFVLRYFVNDCRDKKSRHYHGEVDRVKNIGTFLSRIGEYSKFEQIFAAGIHDVDPKTHYKLSDLPKELIKLLQQHELKLDDDTVTIYNRNPVMFRNFMETECITLTATGKRELLGGLVAHYTTNFFRLIESYKYNHTALIKYIDYLMTYEAMDMNTIVNELLDYVRMMSQISPKYDKYPRNFLTSHQIATRNFERLKKEYNEDIFKKCIDKSLQWKYDNYVVIYPKTTQEIRDEAVSLHHCVSSYIDRIIEGKHHIVFLRYKSSKDESLVTMQIVDNRVVQAKGRFNRDTTKHEAAIIEKYNAYLLKRHEKANMINNIMETEVAVC